MTDENVPELNKDVIINLFKQFANVEDINETAAEAVMNCCNLFWDLVTKSWECYAIHAGRDHLEKSDIQLHMLRIDLITDYNTFSTLAAEHLPLELKLEVLEIAQAKMLSKKQAVRHRLHMNTSIYSAGQIYARRKLFSPMLRKSGVSSKIKK